MKPHIGKIVSKIATIKDKTPLNLAHDLHTDRRNVYNLLDKEDFGVHKLWELSEILGYNFFADLHPNIEKSEADSFQDTQATYKEREMTMTIQVTYPISKANDLGTFMKQVHGLATKLGFKLV